MYVTKNYDFFSAINANLNRDDLEIDTVTHITENSSIVETPYGDFFCTSFKGDDGEVYMQVCEYQ